MFLYATFVETNAEGKNVYDVENATTTVPTALGKYQVIVKVTGAGNYTGEAYGYAAYEITGKSIANATVNVSGVTDQAYGATQAQTPVVDSVVLDGATLVAITDYAVSSEIKYATYTGKNAQNIKTLLAK